MIAGSFPRKLFESYRETTPVRHLRDVIEGLSDEEIFDLAIESGADECISNNDLHEVQCSVNEIYNVKKKLEKRIKNFISTEIEWIPLNSVNILKDNEESQINFFETLEEDDDVQNVYSNAEFGK